jgi:shikimate dehydrogenase
MTSIFGIVGDPIAQARSPEVFNALFRQRRVDAVMTPMLVSVENFEAALLGLRALENVVGLVITVPHKAAAARLMKSGSQRAKMALAANALRPCAGGWEGDLFDGEGFVRGMQSEGRSVRGARCSVVGCGGAGAAISFALLEAGVRSLSVWDIDLLRAEALGERLRQAYGKNVPVARADSTTDIAINATPLGMQPNDPLPIDVASLRSDAIVADAIMKPPLTRLLMEALRHGCEIHAGRHMLDNQVESIWSFFGLPRPDDGDRERSRSDRSGGESSEIVRP